MEEVVEIIRSNEGFLVRSKYNDGDPQLQNIDFFKTKFERLTASKNNTGDPSCLDYVRRAKRIARPFLALLDSIVVGDSEDDNGSGNKYIIDLVNEERIIGSADYDYANSLNCSLRPM